VGAPGASLLGTWVSVAAIRSRSSENYFSRICSTNPYPKAHNFFPFYFNQLQNQLERIVSQESAVGFDPHKTHALALSYPLPLTLE
jgi:hypothetical protein